MTNIKQEFEEVLEKLGTYWYESGARVDGVFPRLNQDEALNSLLALHQREVERELQRDRKANTEFWKAKIDRIFDVEIEVYANQLKAKGENNE